MAQDGIGSMYEKAKVFPGYGYRSGMVQKAAAQGQPDAQAALKRLGQ